MRDGKYWTGDLGYRDDAGFFYFAGRNSDWLRVDGENFAAAPVEQVHLPPSRRRARRGLRGAVARRRRRGDGRDAPARGHRRSIRTDSSTFLGAQSDLSPKWMPRFVRISHGLPSTATQKVLKRVLQRERWECDDDGVVATRPRARVPAARRRRRRQVASALRRTRTANTCSVAAEAAAFEPADHLLRAASCAKRLVDRYRERRRGQRRRSPASTRTKYRSNSSGDRGARPDDRDAALKTGGLVADRSDRQRHGTRSRSATRRDPSAAPWRELRCEERTEALRRGRRGHR